MIPILLVLSYCQLVLLRRLYLRQDGYIRSQTSVTNHVSHADASTNNNSNDENNDGNSMDDHHDRNQRGITKNIEISTHREECGGELSTTPIWMYPSRKDDWKRIPLVSFESYHEYQTLLQSIRRDYAEMVERILIDVNNSSIPYINATLMPWSIGHYGFMRSVLRRWIKEGEKIFLKLTKGVGRDWCSLVSINFATRLNTAVRVFVMNNPLFESARSSMAGFEECREEILDFLRKEIDYNIDEEDLNPNDRNNTLESVNFTYYSLAPRNVSDPFLTYYTPDENHGMMPIGKFQEIMLAFAMGTHTRKTEAARTEIDEKESPVRMLTDDLLRIIFKYDIFHAN